MRFHRNLLLTYGRVHLIDLFLGAVIGLFVACWFRLVFLDISAFVIWLICGFLVLFVWRGRMQLCFSSGGSTGNEYTLF
jgi:hypothetical protein